MESVEGKGSFTITIPVQAVSAVPESLDPAEVQKKRTGNILVVEDDPVNRKVMKQMLSIAGYVVLEAANGEEAVKLCKSEQPDVILMDVQMPLMDGLEATRAIRAHEAELGLERSAIYGLTAYVLEEHINRCLTAGMSGHIGKPIDFNLLRQAIKKHIED